MKILVLGAGAVGGYFFGRLAQNGAEVDVVCRSDYETVREHGYKIKSINGDFDFKPHAVFNDAGQAASNKYDYVALTAKVLPEANFVEQLRKVLGNAAIVQVQNGVEIEAPLAEAFKDNALISSIAYIGVHRESPGHIVHQGGGRLRMGLYQGNNERCIDKLTESFMAAKVDCKKVNDIRHKRWVKLLWNAPFNSLSVLSGGCNTQEMINDPEIALLAENIMRDVQQTARCRKVELTEEEIQWTLEYTRNFPAYKSSMLIDYEAGRPLEVESILGNALRIARESKIKTPYLESTYALLRALDHKKQQSR